MPAVSPGTWGEFGFVHSSRYRESVLRSLGSRPKFPHELAEETRIRIFHVSRALRELASAGLVRCVTSGRDRRGRLYQLTDSGSALFFGILLPAQAAVPEVLRTRPETGFVPRFRAYSLLRLLDHVRETAGSGALIEALGNWEWRGVPMAEDDWIPVRAAQTVLECLEQRFGDGSYRFVREVSAQVAPRLGVLRRAISRRVPLPLLARTAPEIYARESNFGRVEVEVRRHWIALRHYDWLPTPALCSMFWGVYEGVLRGRREPASVAKERCVLRNDPACEYVIRWGRGLLSSPTAVEHLAPP